MCYRPPNQNLASRTSFIDGLSNAFDIINNRYKKPFVLVGDFNDRCQTWNDDHKNSELGLELVNLINSFYLMQMINQPTRNESLLDLIITNCPNYFRNVGIWDPINDLDHSPIYGHVKFSYPKKQNYRRTIYNYSSEHITKLNNNLNKVPWHAILQTHNSIDDMVETYTTIVKTKSVSASPIKVF